MISFLFSLFLVLSSPASTETTCPQPSNVHVTSRSAGAITFDWDNVIGPTNVTYKVQYVRLADSYTSPVYSNGSSDYGFSNMQTGDYEFYFWTDCGEEGLSEAIVIEDIVEN